MKNTCSNFPPPKVKSADALEKSPNLPLDKLETANIYSLVKIVAVPFLSTYQLTDKWLYLYSSYLFKRKVTLKQAW